MSNTLGKKSEKYQFVWKGLSYPFRFSASGGVATSSGLDKIEQRLFLIAYTSFFELARNPKFGIGLNDFIHQPFDPDIKKALIGNEVFKRFSEAEPSITFKKVLVKYIEPSTISLTVLFQEKLTQRERQVEITV